MFLSSDSPNDIPLHTEQHSSSPLWPVNVIKSLDSSLNEGPPLASCTAATWACFCHLLHFITTPHHSWYSSSSLDIRMPEFQPSMSSVSKTILQECCCIYGRVTCILYTDMLTMQIQLQDKSPSFLPPQNQIPTPKLLLFRILQPLLLMPIL